MLAAELVGVEMDEECKRDSRYVIVNVVK